MIYVILGMGKSGTTLVSKMLHKSGIRMVEDENDLMTYKQGNHYEDSQFNEINYSLLGCEGLHSLEINLNQKLNSNSISIEKGKNIIERNTKSYSDWGFKDPRTCLTYSFWEKILPSHRIIIVYRDPYSVFKHYNKNKKKNPLRMYRSVNHWRTYNQRIINIISSKPRESYLIFNYEDLMTSDNVIKELSLFCNKSITDVRDKNQWNTKPGNNIPFRVISWLKYLSSGVSNKQIIDNLNNLKL